MKELRCLVFTEPEVIKAVLDRRQRLREPLPTGTVKGVGHRHGNGVETILTIVSDAGESRELLLSETEVAAAMVAYCMGRRIPLPVASDKALHLINGALTLMITMNFQKAPRLVTPLAANGPKAGGAGAVAGARRKVGA
ncbi:hypothetical protein [Azospirillum agricola]|uniref:hypothetical protein n=1 Tax=Azospirillum agricola TaxID=1720247 RepID=UPI000A0F0B8D|nr:hypothetical protein [Azospirillum agricola]SMH55318.1 hypothetical protein SAMN02982994_3792 [Azospirillum lipoferum]